MIHVSVVMCQWIDASRDCRLLWWLVRSLPEDGVSKLIDIRARLARDSVLFSNTLYGNPNYPKEACRRQVKRERLIVSRHLREELLRL